MSTNTTRRRWLRTAAGAALGLPFLSGLLGRIGEAQEGRAPQRFYLMFTGNGQLPEHWVPSAGDLTSSPVLAPLAAHRDKLLVLHGLRGTDGHSGGMSEATTGRPSRTEDGVANGGPSLDQYLADEWHGTTPLRSLELGVMPANDPNDQTCYSARGLPVPPIGAALGGFERVFGVTNEDPAVAERRRAQQRSVLDAIARDGAALGARLGPSSRALLDEHLTLVREQEALLARPYTPLTCDALARPEGGAGMVDTWTAHHRTIVAAFRCGATRVATLRAGGWGGIESGGYDEIGIAAGHHDVSHGGSSDPEGNLLAINRFHAERFAEVVAALDAVPEGDGTLLDNTTVIWLNELGLGVLNNHGREDVNVVMAGGAAAGFAQGRFHHLGDADYGHFLYTIARQLGDPALARFGDAGERVLPELLA